MRHGLRDELLFTAALRTRLKDEAMFETNDVNARYWALAELQNASPIQYQGGYVPEAHERLIADQVLRSLNKEINHGGCWVVGWTDNATRFIMLWIDKDGDVQFTVDVDECGRGMVEAPLLRWIGQAEEAWMLWRKHMVQVLDPKPDQLYKRAQGQRAPSVN